MEFALKTDVVQIDGYHPALLIGCDSEPVIKGCVRKPVIPTMPPRPARLFVQGDQDFAVSKRALFAGSGVRRKFVQPSLEGRIRGSAKTRAVVTQLP